MLTIMKALRQDIKSMVKEMGGAREEYADNLDRYLTPLPGVSSLSILPGVIRMFWKMQMARKNLAKFIKENPDWCRAQCQRIKAIQNREELASLYTHEYQARIVETFWRVYATFFHYADLTGKLRGKRVEMVGIDDADILLSNTSRDDELLPSLGPLVGLSKLVRGEISRDEYLEQLGTPRTVRSRARCSQATGRL
jgi:pyruvate,water dikinase